MFDCCSSYIVICNLTHRTILIFPLVRSGRPSRTLTCFCNLFGVERTVLFQMTFLLAIADSSFYYTLSLIVIDLLQSLLVLLPGGCLLLSNLWLFIFWCM